MGVEPTTPTLQGSVASNGMQAQPEIRPGSRTGIVFIEWVVKELNLSSSASLVLRQRLYRPP